MLLFKYTDQEWFNLDSIEHIQDLGWGIDVRLKSGKVCSIGGNRREGFLSLIQPKAPAITQDVE
jgi:hypothetical protein